MTWIRRVEETEAQGMLKTLYEGIQRQMGMVPEGGPGLEETGHLHIR